jgi:hypothetical protein
MADLVGTWFSGGDGALVHVSQRGNEVFSASLSSDRGKFNNGISATYVLRGQLAGDRLIATWAYVPRGTQTGSGTVELAVDLDGNGEATHMHVITETGGFPTVHLWHTMLFTQPPPPIRTLFNAAKRNGGDTLGEKLKLYKDPITVFGTVEKNDRKRWATVNYSPTRGRDYKSFICSGKGDITSPPDGDINFDIIVDRQQLDAQYKFWKQGWIKGRDPNKLRKKLDKYKNHIHCEVVIYARDRWCRDLHKNPFSAPQLPGWQEYGGNSVLLNGRPINGQAQIGKHIKADSYELINLGGYQWPIGQRVRVYGPLVVDTEGSASSDNTEMHPVYAIDIINATAKDDISGTWADQDGGTYYVSQVGDAVWWFATAPFRTELFSGVFNGTINDGHVVGSHQWVPRGFRAFELDLDLSLDASKLTMTVNSGTLIGGPIGGKSLVKLYDAPSPIIIPAPPPIP